MSVPKRCLVTGGSGFVGQRLSEILLERGATRVVSFDKAPKPHLSSDDPRITWMVGDITSMDDCMKATEGIDCVFNIAALVGPFHPEHLYEKINSEGTFILAEACKRNNVQKFVCAGTPSTRFHWGMEMTAQPFESLTIPKPGKFVAKYAETKYMAEVGLREMISDTFLPITVAPHQVYGPRDSLFLPNLLGTMQSGKLRVFGRGDKLIDVCHVDNYCHGLIISADKLYPNSPCLGKFYLVTDDEPQNLWDMLDSAGTYMGYKSLRTRAALPTWLLFTIASIVEGIGSLFQALMICEKFKVLRTMKLTRFTVTMMTIHRYFDITPAKRELGYEPVIRFEKGWEQTKVWFKREWAPKHRTTEEIRANGWS